MNHGTPWRRADQVLSLQAREIHLWRVALDRSTESVETLRAILSPSELDRAERLRSPLHGRRFVVGRAALRLILADYTGEGAGNIHFEHNAHGKPFLSDSGDGSHGGLVRFNLTNTDNLAVVAVASGMEVGVDIERLREMPNADRLVKRFFAAGEQAAYRRVAVSLQQKAFFQLWTRKEAFIKAVGDGLAIPLDRFEVSLSGSEQPTTLTEEGRSSSSASWWIRPFDPGTGFVGSLATEMPDCRLRYLQWQPRR